MSNSMMILSGCLFSISVAYLTLFYRFVKIKNQYESMFVDLVVLNHTIDELEESKIKSDESVHKENFIKFISDSRDWAYEYIENAQKIIIDVVDKTQSTIDYNKEYGSLSIEPYATHINTLADAIEELKVLIPSEEKE